MRPTDRLSVRKDLNASHRAMLRDWLRRLDALDPEDDDAPMSIFMEAVNADLQDELALLMLGRMPSKEHVRPKLRAVK